MQKQGIYYLWGEERYRIDQEIHRIAAAIAAQCGEEPEVVYIDVDELSPEQLLEQMDFSPLFALQRVVVLRRPYWLGKSRRKSGKLEQLYGALTQLFQQPAAGQTVVITADEYPATHPLIKKISKMLTVIACPRMEPAALVSWVEDTTQRQHKKITKPAARMLAKSGQDMYYLEHLVEKICLQTDEPVIDEAAVGSELAAKPDLNIFKLTDAILARRAADALTIYYELLRQGGHPSLFLHMIVRQLASLGKVKDHTGQGLSNSEVAATTGMKDFAVRKLAQAARNFTWDELQNIFSECLNTDLQMKSSGQDEKILMESLIIKICSRDLLIGNPGRRA